MIPQSAYFPGVLYSHYSECDLSPWSNFSFESDPKLYCSLTKRFFLHRESMNRLQLARERLGKPVLLKSGHRSPIYNAAVRGAVRSAHKYLAFDVDFAISGYDRIEVAEALKVAGFNAYGFYNSFVHVDMWYPRMWHGSPSAKRLWNMDRAWLER